MSPPRIVAVVGATATGKTAVAERLARALDAEIVCADSRQVFAELEIGTGRPTPAERAAWPHHLFGALPLGQPPSAGWYARAAGEAMAGIHGRGRAALLVGGSGLYLRAAQQGLAATPPHDPAVRARLRAELASAGPEALHARLAAVDPAGAARLQPRDRQRVSRALEVLEATGHPLAWWHDRTPGPRATSRWNVIEIRIAPEALRSRIAARTTAMFDQGLAEETRGLLAAGLGDALRALRAIGYEEADALLAGALDRAAAERRVNERTAQLAKRQRTWFRHQIEAVRLDADGIDPDRVAAMALAALDAPAGRG